MAELTFKSPGVSTREIDLTGPDQVVPTGVPAGVIGTANQGRAFIPITVATFADFIVEFGNTDGEKFGPLAVRQWLANARSASYIRLLGAGNAKKRNSDGSVTNAGFVVGQELPKANGYEGRNLFAGTPTAGNPGVLGRTHFLGTIMSESAGSSYLRDAGLLGTAQPLVRGVILAPSGVIPALSASRGLDDFSGNNQPLGGPSSTNVPAKGAFGSFAGANDGGSPVGGVRNGNSKQEFVLLLNGHTNNSTYPNIITASFDPQAPNYMATILNTDPENLQKAGHVLYAHWPVYSAYATPTGSILMNSAFNYSGSGNTKVEDIAFLVTSSLGRNAGNATIPNFEGFTDRFRTAVSPYVISQAFGGLNKNLFRVHALDDGAIGNTRIKISIENIKKSNNDNYPYGVFDLLVRDYSDTDGNMAVIESYRGINIDPLSENYIGRRIGDYRIYYDFDKAAGAQKLVVDGAYPNKSHYIRVEIPDEVAKGDVPKGSLPVGFRGVQHLVTSGSSIFKVAPGSELFAAADVASRLVQPPLPLRHSVGKGVAPKKRVDTNLYWGTQFAVNDKITEPNNSVKIDIGMPSYGTYFPNYAQTTQAAWIGNNEGAVDAAGTIYDADRFNNNLFSLERIQVITKGSDNDIANSTEWAAATYRRKGVASSAMNNTAGTSISAGGASSGTRLLNVDKDFGLSSARPFLKYTFMVQGGFDGVNIFNKDKADFTNNAVLREILDSDKQGGTSGPTVATYRKAIDIFGEKSVAEIKLLAIPGIRRREVTDYAIDAMEERFDALYLMDIEERDNVNDYVTGSNNLISVTNTVSNFTSRNLDTSFAAAYFPDLVITDPATQTNVRCPPTVGVLGAFALNDAVAHPWFAPAGFTRGALNSTLETVVKFSRANLDTLYEADINPITSFPETQGVVVFGQKTLLAAQSALDRVNVRRLLIDIRRKVRMVGDGFLFEPNRESTLARFSNAVNPILARIQQQQGLSRFKVIIDTSTTTQADVENNTIRGKIFLQPVRSIEFVSLDFVITNAGTDI